MAFMTVYQTFSSADAQLIRSRLEAAEFHPFIANESFALNNEGDPLTTGGIAVQVPEEEAADARALLEAPPAE